MPVEYEAPVKNARLAATVAQIDAGAMPGAIRLFAADGVTLLAAVQLAKPCATVEDGVLRFVTEPALMGEGVADGDAATATIADGDGNVCARGLTVGGDEADIMLTGGVSIAKKQVVEILDAIIVHA